MSSTLSGSPTTRVPATTGMPHTPVVARLSPALAGRRITAQAAAAVAAAQEQARTAIGGRRAAATGPARP